MSSAGQPIATPTVQPVQAPMSQWQQMQNIMRQRAMAQALMSSQRQATTPLQSATNAAGMMAGAWGEHQADDKMQRLLQGNPQLALQAQQSPGLLDRIRSFLGGGQPGAQGSTFQSPAAMGAQGIGVQLGPQNSMPSNMFGMGPPQQ